MGQNRRLNSRIAFTNLLSTLFYSTCIRIAVKTVTTTGATVHICVQMDFHNCTIDTCAPCENDLKVKKVVGRFFLKKLNIYSVKA